MAVVVPPDTVAVNVDAPPEHTVALLRDKVTVGLGFTVTVCPDEVLEQPLLFFTVTE